MKIARPQLRLSRYFKINYFQILTLGFCIVFLSACDSNTESKTETSTAEPLEYKELQWTDLIPLDDLVVLMNPPSYITEVPDGSEEDQLNRDFSQEYKDDPYQQALVSTNVIEEMDGKAVKLPGFIVPLDYKKDQLISEFFIVPYFGACIHVPPPPPNQIIYVKYPEGLKVPALYDPFMLTGVLKIEYKAHELGAAAYSMDVHSIEPYSE